MAYELRDHTADIAVAATGDSLEDVFAAVADGLAAASCDELVETGERFSLAVTAESREALLFDYLDELIYLRDVRLELPVSHRVDAIQHGSADEDDTTGEEWTLEASARGVPLSALDAREIKAVTYSEMELERVDEGDGWSAYVVFDV
ncbi:archease [Natronolimnobius sp. AArcel1]|uniref:archease n=1 Tax=Natronolimnobius sp. AArcel1 TaxID=1679093 RepID=UPI0013EBEEC8|nr:archease [Natronolimnobius sp. AArcel1]NGM69316.1 archease [Natronolimnobius sp. AArcel1]